jgi:CheY-like chemotaxis protein
LGNKERFFDPNKYLQQQRSLPIANLALLVISNLHFMLNKSETVTILIADNDPRDRLLIQEALTGKGSDFNIYFVSNEDELLAYLHRVGKYAQPHSAPTPNLILLDLNMHYRGRKEVIKEIKGNPNLNHIPVIVLTNCDEEEFLCKYYPGGNSYISKPTSFEQMVDLMEIIYRYWFEVVMLPDRRLIEAIE